jgi:hypothetical protein
VNGKNYLKEKEEPMPMKLPKTYKNEGATSKYPKKTDTKAFGHIPEVYVALKNVFFLDRSCFFSATVLYRIFKACNTYFTVIVN